MCGQHARRRSGALAGTSLCCASSVSSAVQLQKARSSSCPGSTLRTASSIPLSTTQQQACPGKDACTMVNNPDTTQMQDNDNKMLGVSALQQALGTDHMHNHNIDP